MPVPDLDRAKIDAFSLHAVIAGRACCRELFQGISFPTWRVIFWPLKKSQAPTWQSAWETASRLHSLKPGSRSHARWRWRIEWDRQSTENISSREFAANKLRNDLITTVVIVGVIHLLILVWLTDLNHYLLRGVYKSIAMLDNKWTNKSSFDLMDNFVRKNGIEDFYENPN